MNSEEVGSKFLWLCHGRPVSVTLDKEPGSLGTLRCCLRDYVIAIFILKKEPSLKALTSSENYFSGSKEENFRAKGSGCTKAD